MKRSQEIESAKPFTHPFQLIENVCRDIIFSRSVCCSFVKGMQNTVKTLTRKRQRQTSKTVG